MATNATAVSAVLRRGGLLPVPRSREGIHVTVGRGHVTVTISVDSGRRRNELTYDAIEILTNQGYTIARHDSTPHIFTVTKES